MKIHIVQKGDTLWNIAKKYGVNFEELKKMNAQLSNPEMIMPGMKIKVPTTGGNIKKETAMPKKEMSGGGHQFKEQPMPKMPEAGHPFKEQPMPKMPVQKEIIKEVPIVKEVPIIKEIPKKETIYKPIMPQPVIPEIDINNYYSMNMTQMQAQMQPQYTPPPPPPVKVEEESIESPVEMPMMPVQEECVEMYHPCPPMPCPPMPCPPPLDCGCGPTPYHHMAPYGYHAPMGHYPMPQVQGEQMGYYPMPQVQGEQMGHYPMPQVQGEQMGHYYMPQVQGEQMGHYPMPQVQGEQMGHYYMPQVQGEQMGHYPMHQVQGGQMESYPEYGNWMHDESSSIPMMSNPTMSQHHGGYGQTYDGQYAGMQSMQSPYTQQPYMNVPPQAQHMDYHGMGPSYQQPQNYPYGADLRYQQPMQPWSPYSYGYPAHMGGYPYPQKEESCDDC